MSYTKKGKLPSNLRSALLHVLATADRDLLYDLAITNGQMVTLDNTNQELWVSCVVAPQNDGTTELITMAIATKDGGIYVRSNGHPMASIFTHAYDVATVVSRGIGELRRQQLMLIMGEESGAKPTDSVDYIAALESVMHARSIVTLLSLESMLLDHSTDVL